jgi:Zn-dependent peptidase ImmA (M78 family)
VKLTSTVNRGFYYFTHDRHYIALSTRLKADQRRLVGWHEFAHFLENYYLRKPVAAFADLEPDRPSEKLANIFAAIAVNPAAIGITRPLDFVKMLMETKV